MRGAVAIGLAVLAVTAGCGGDGVSAATRERLGDRLDDARGAARARDGAGVRRALASFRTSVRSARERGEISDEDAGRLLTAALAASRRARAEITPAPTPTPTAAPTAFAPSAPEPPPAAAKGKGKGKGRGKGHGKGGDD